MAAPTAAGRRIGNSRPAEKASTDRRAVREPRSCRSGSSSFSRIATRPLVRVRAYLPDHFHHLRTQASLRGLGVGTPGGLMSGEPARLVGLAALVLGADARPLARAGGAGCQRSLAPKRRARKGEGDQGMESGSRERSQAVGAGFSRSCGAQRKRRDRHRSLHHRQPAARRTGEASRRLSILGCRLALILWIIFVGAAMAAMLLSTLYRGHGRSHKKALGQPAFLPHSSSSRASRPQLKR